MKAKKLCSLILLIALCCTFILFGLVGCNTDEINNKFDSMQSEIDKLKNDKANAAALAELNAMVEQVKSAADAAATAASLAEIAEKLEAVKAVSDASASLTKLNEVKAELTALVEANATADEATKDALNAAVDKVEALEKTLATKAELNSAIEKVEAELAAKADISALTEELDKLEALIAEVDKSADDSYNALVGEIDTLDGVLASIEGRVTVNENDITALQDALKGINNTIATLATSEELEEKISDVTSKLDSAVSALGDNKADKTALDSLEETVNALKETVEDAKAEQDEAFKTLNSTVSDMKKDIEANGADIDALEESVSSISTTLETIVAKDEFNSFKSEYENTIKGIEEELATKADQSALEDAVAALEKSIADAVEATDGKYGELEAALASLEETVTGKADKTALEGVQKIVDGINADVDEINNAIAEINGDVVDMQTQFTNEVEKVKSDFDEFKKEYAADKETIEANATAIEALDASIKALEQKDFLAGYKAATEMLYDGEFSLTAFDEKVGSVKKENYVDEAYKKFEATCARIKFFLGRAVSVEAIKGYFEELDKAIGDMPTYAETLQEMLDSVTVITLDTDFTDHLTNITNLKTKVADEELGEVYIAKYNNIVGAYDNLQQAYESAESVEAAIENIGYVVYTDSEVNIETAKAEIENYKATYFANETYNSYYGETNETVVVENWQVYSDACARYEVLSVAAENKVDITIALGYNEQRPLFSDYNDISAVLAEYVAWLGDAIDEEKDAKTIVNIYGEGNVDLLKSAAEYAEAMKSVYETYEFSAEVVGVDALNSLIDALISNNVELVLWADKTVADTYSNYLDALKNAIAGASDDFVAELDSNFNEMVGSERLDNFEQVYERMKELDEAKGQLDTIYDEMAEIETVEFKHYDSIIAWGNEITAVYNEYGITVDDSNSVEFDKVKPARLRQIELVDKYKEITKDILEVYEAVEQALSGGWVLQDGHKIPDLKASLVHLAGKGIVNLMREEGDVEADTASLTMQYANITADYYEKADVAEKAAEDVIAKIAAVRLLNAKDVKNYAKIVEEYESFIAWQNEYLAGDVEISGSVEAALEAIDGILTSDESREYVFVSLIDYNYILGAYNDAYEWHTGAEDYWTNTLQVELENLTNDSWNIHTVTEFNRVNTLYTEYVDTYYDGIIDADTALFGEVAVYGEFKACLDACQAKVDSADDKKQEIETAISEIADITRDNYLEEQTKIDAVNTLIDEYKTFCPELCSECIDEDLMLTFRKAEATAALAKEFDVVNSKISEDKSSALNQLWGIYVVPIKDATTVEAVNESLGNVTELLKNNYPCVYGGDHADTNTDSACDNCGATIE